MDNRVISQIKRGLKVTSSYGVTLILLLVFIMPIIGIAKENAGNAMIYVSFFLFLILFATAYIDMRDIAIKEKRPQYDLNPSPMKGLLYGLIGIAPLIIIEACLMLIKFPEGITALIRRIWQGINGPLYWVSRLLGNQPVHYIISFILVVVIAGLGYYAGHKGFYLIAFIRTKLGIKQKVRKKR